MKFQIIRLNSDIKFHIIVGLMCAVAFIFSIAYHKEDEHLISIILIAAAILNILKADMIMRLRDALKSVDAEFEKGRIGHE